MHNFIVSGNGFLKSITFNPDLNEFIIDWTPVLRDAVRFKSKTASGIISKHKLDAFIWNPYKEEPIRGKWEIVRRSSFTSYEYNETHNVLEWEPKRVVMEKRTDVDYLLTKGVNNKTYYDSYQEAVAACQVQNIEILKELHNKIDKLNASIS